MSNTPQSVASLFLNCGHQRRSYCKFLIVSSAGGLLAQLRPVRVRACPPADQSEESANLGSQSGVLYQHAR